MLPDILTANCYFWRPGGSANQRRWNEARRAKEVTDWVAANKTVLEEHNIDIHFTYEESTVRVYKKVQIYQNNVKKDIRLLKKVFGG